MNTAEAMSILGVSETTSEPELKRIFREKAKRLHPDKNPGDCGAHIDMIELNQAYNMVRSRFEGGRAAGDQGGRRKNDDYQIYKRGILWFKRIHPSTWVDVSAAGLFDPSAINPRQSVREGALEALSAIEAAYRLFSEVVNEYPESMWRRDCLDKMAMLEKMTALYKRILVNARTISDGFAHE